MYKDRDAMAAVQNLQVATRKYLAARYGARDSYTLDLTLAFPESMGGGSEVLTVETAPVAWMPHAVHVFLNAAVSLKQKSGWRCAFHRRAGHVLQAFISGAGAPGLAFQEYDARFPHEAYTLGFAGRPGGPAFYISTVDNVANHGPGSQGSRTEADSCFAKVVGSRDVVNRMKTQPGGKPPNGFISDNKNFIVVENVALRDS